MPRSLSGSLDLPHHQVVVSEEQPHLGEEPPQVQVVGLLHHQLGELQHAGAGAAVRLERLHKGQEPSESLIWNLKFVMKLLPAARSNFVGSGTYPDSCSSARRCSWCLSSMKPAMRGCSRSGRLCAANPGSQHIIRT